MLTRTLTLTCTPGLRAADLLGDVERQREVSVRSHALGEQSFSPALADDPVRGAGGGHHHDHRDEAAGEGNYLHNDPSEREPDKRDSINFERFPWSVCIGRGCVHTIT